MTDLAREIAEDISDHARHSAMRGDVIPCPPDLLMEDIIAAKLAAANTARDERDAKALELLETAHARMMDHWEAKGDVAKALALLGGGDGD